MIKAAQLPLAIDRGAPRLYTFKLIGVDLTGAAWAGAIRLQPDSDASIVDLLPVVDATKAGARLLQTGLDDDGVTPVSWLRLQIPAMVTGASAGEMPAAAELGTALLLYWDFFIAPVGQTASRLLYGTVSVNPTATKPAVAFPLEDDPLSADVIVRIGVGSTTIDVSAPSLLAIMSKQASDAATQTAADRAQTGADVISTSQYAAAASAVAKAFPDFAGGVAGTAAGDYFSVLDGAGVWISIYRNGTSEDADHPLIQLPGKAAYAGGGGTGLLGDQLDAAGAALIMQAAINAERISPYRFGAIGDGVADDTAALQHAIDAAVTRNKVLDLVGGTYKVTGSLTAAGNIRIVNSGGAIIRAAPGTYAQTGILNILGSATQIENLGADAVQGAWSITAAAASSLVAGDLASIYNPTGASWSNFRAYYNAGEFIQVNSVDGATINLRNQLYDSYAADANPPIQCYKINAVSGFIKDIIIESEGYTDNLIYLDYGRDFRIINPSLVNKNDTCIYVSRSVGTVIENPRVVNTGDGGDDYGISIGGQHTRIIGGDIMARRHAVMAGCANRVNDVPCRDLLTTGATLRNDPASDTHCADLHGCSEDCGYVDCTIFGGFSPQGKNVRFLNNRVHSMLDGVCAYAAEIRGGSFEMRGNTFFSHADPFAVSRGVIDFGGNSSNVLTADTQESPTIIVADTPSSLPRSAPARAFCWSAQWRGRPDQRRIHQ